MARYRIDWYVHRGGHFDVEANSGHEAIDQVKAKVLDSILAEIEDNIHWAVSIAEKKEV